MHSRYLQGDNESKAASESGPVRQKFSANLPNNDPAHLQAYVVANRRTRFSDLGRPQRFTWSLGLPKWSDDWRASAKVLAGRQCEAHRRGRTLPACWTSSYMSAYDRFLLTDSSEK